MIKMEKILIPFAVYLAVLYAFPDSSFATTAQPIMFSGRGRMC